VVFEATEIDGVLRVRLERRTDDRGWFARAWCRSEFGDRGLPTEFVQANAAYTRRGGTIRGLHYQVAPHEEAKLVRCTRGAIYDVALDLRHDSPTCGRWVSAKLAAASDEMLFVPPGCAHGYQTLVDDTEVFYFVSTPYHAEAERGVRWNDPRFAIAWPIAPPMLSEKDAHWPDFDR